MNKHIIFILLAFFFTVGTLSSQTNKWFHFAPNDRMNDMAREGDDLWIHTEDGLVKFDVANNSFSFFDVTDPRVKSNQIHGLARLGSGGGIVVVTYDFGLLSINNGQWTYFDTLNSALPSYDPFDITADNDGNVWVITRSVPSIVKYDGTNWEVYPIPDTAFADFGSTLNADDDGNIWVGTDFRLMKFKDSVWTDYTPGLVNDGGTIAGVDFIYRDKSDRVWLNTAENLYRYDGSAWTLIKDDFGKVDICEDDLNGIWVTRNNGGNHELFKLVNDSLELKNSSNSNLPSDFYSSVYRDWDDGVWMGGNPGLLTWFKSGIWEGHDLKNSVISDRVNYDIKQDENDHIWVLNRDSLQRFNGTNWETIDFTAGAKGEKLIPIDSTEAFLLSRNNKTNQLSHFENGQWTIYNTTSTFSTGSELRDMTIDEQGKLWVLAKDELYLKDGANWTSYSSSNSTIPPLNLESIISDQNGKVWIATENAETIFSFDGQNITSHTNLSPWTASGKLSQLYRDSTGLMYIYSDEDIVKFDNGQFTNLSIPLSDINHLTRKGSQLVISTNGGLYFWEEGIGYTDSITTTNSLLRYGKPGPFLIDQFENYWIGNLKETSGALSVFNFDEVVYVEKMFTGIFDQLDEFDGWNVSVFPNPVENMLTIAIDLAAKDRVGASLLDLNGRLIARNEFNGYSNQEWKVDMSYLPAGMYVLQISDGSRQMSKKLIKY